MAHLNQRCAHWHCSHFLARSVCHSVRRAQEETGLSLMHFFFTQPFWKQPNNSEAVVGSLSLSDQLLKSTKKSKRIKKKRHRDIQLSGQVRRQKLRRKKKNSNNNRVTVSEHVPFCVYVCFYLTCQHQLYFSLPSCPAHRSLCHKCQQTGIHLIHCASRSISHPPVKSRIQPRAPPCLLCCFILPPRCTHAALTTAKTNTNLCRDTVYKMVTPPFK